MGALPTCEHNQSLGCQNKAWMGSQRGKLLQGQKRSTVADMRVRIFFRINCNWAHIPHREHVKHLKLRMHCASQVLSVTPHIGKSEMAFPKIGNLQHSHFL